MGRGGNRLLKTSPGVSSIRQGESLWRGVNKTTQVSARTTSGVIHLGARAFRAYNGFLAEKFGMDKRARLAHFGIISGAGLMMLSTPVLGIGVALALAAPNLHQRYKHQQLRNSPVIDEITAEVDAQLEEPLPEDEAVSRRARQERLKELLQQGDYTEREQLLINELLDTSKEQKELAQQFDNLLHAEAARQKAKARRAVEAHLKNQAAAKAGGEHVEPAVPEAQPQGLTEEEAQKVYQAIYQTTKENPEIPVQQQAEKLGIPEDLAVAARTNIETSMIINNQYSLDDVPLSQETVAFKNEDGENIELAADFYPATEKQLGSRDTKETDLLYRAYQVCLAHGQLSPTLLQRELKIGYPKARNLISRLIASGMFNKEDYSSINPGKLNSKRNVQEVSKRNHPYWQQLRQTVAARALNSPGEQLTVNKIAKEYHIPPAAGRQVLKELVDNKVINKNRVSLSSTKSKSKIASKKQAQSIASLLNPRLDGEFNKEAYLEKRKQERHKAGNMFVPLNSHTTEHMLSGGGGWEWCSGVGKDGQPDSKTNDKLVTGMRTFIYSENAIHGYCDIEEVIHGTPEEVWQQVKDRDFSFDENQFWSSHEVQEAQDEGGIITVYKTGNRQRFPEPISRTDKELLGGELNVVMGKKISEPSHKDFAAQEKIIQLSEENDARIAAENNGVITPQATAPISNDSKWIESIAKNIRAKNKWDNNPPEAFKPTLKQLGIEPDEKGVYRVVKQSATV